MDGLSVEMVNCASSGRHRAITTAAIEQRLADARERRIHSAFRFLAWGGFVVTQVYFLIGAR